MLLSPHLTGTQHTHLVQTNFMPKHQLPLVIITHVIPVLLLQVQQSFVGTITPLAQEPSNVLLDAPFYNKQRLNQSL